MTSKASVPAKVARKACVSRTCGECPADTFCNDLSLKGQIAKVLAERCPAIVLSTRIGILLAEGTAAVAA